MDMHRLYLFKRVINYGTTDSNYSHGLTFELITLILFFQPHISCMQTSSFPLYIRTRMLRCYPIQKQNKSEFRNCFDNTLWYLVSYFTLSFMMPVAYFPYILRWVYHHQDKNTQCVWFVLKMIHINNRCNLQKGRTNPWCLQEELVPFLNRLFSLHHGNSSTANQSEPGKMQCIN